LCGLTRTIDQITEGGEAMAFLGDIWSVFMRFMLTRKIAPVLVQPAALLFAGHFRPGEKLTLHSFSRRLNSARDAAGVAF
jgi:hypothetical protein